MNIKIRKTSRGLTLKNKFLGYLYSTGSEQYTKEKVRDIYGDNTIAIERKSNVITLKSFAVLSNN